MTTILEIEATAWKKDVYSELSNADVETLKKAIKAAVKRAGFVTGSLYLLQEEKRSSDLAPVPICKI